MCRLVVGDLGKRLTWSLHVDRRWERVSCHVRTLTGANRDLRYDWSEIAMYKHAKGQNSSVAFTIFFLARTLNLHVQRAKILERSW